jgi:hypothetical protein
MVSRGLNHKIVSRISPEIDRYIFFVGRAAQAGVQRRKPRWRLEPLGLAQVAAMMESHLRARVQREDAWLEALGGRRSTTIQAEASDRRRGGGSR